MDSPKINDWVQVVGIFAVVGSLIFVGFQMQQTKEISMAQAYQSRAAIAVEWTAAIASNPAALSALRKAAEGNMGEIAHAEYDAARWLQVGVFNVFDNTHYQYVSGYVSEELWLMVRGNLKNNMTNPLAREIFDGLREQARPSFKLVLLEIGTEIDSNGGN